MKNKKQLKKIENKLLKDISKAKDPGAKSVSVANYRTFIQACADRTTNWL